MDSSTIEEVNEESDDKSDEESDEEDGIREAGLFDTPMKLKLSANHIHKDVVLPLLKKIVRRLSMDMELRSLQWEILKLSGIVKSVNLQEMFAQNDKAWSMILVPRSRMYERFCVSAKKQSG